MCKPQLPDILNKAYIFKIRLKRGYSTPITCHDSLPFSALSSTSPPTPYVGVGKYLPGETGRICQSQWPSPYLGQIYLLPVGTVHLSHTKYLKSWVPSLRPASKEQKGLKSHRKKM